MLRRRRGIFCIARSFMAFRASRRYERGWNESGTCLGEQQRGLRSAYQWLEYVYLGVALMG